MDRAGYRNAMLLHESEIMKYVEIFMKRNFLHFFDERTKGKVASLKEIDNWRIDVEKQKQNFQKIYFYLA